MKQRSKISEGSNEVQLKLSLVVSAGAHILVLIVCCALSVGSARPLASRVAVFSVCEVSASQLVSADAWPVEPVEVEPSLDDFDILTPDPLFGGSDLAGDIPGEPIESRPDMRRPQLTRAGFVKRSQLPALIQESAILIDAKPVVPEVEHVPPSIELVASVPSPVESANRPPGYPRKAILMGRQGTVLLRVDVDPSGGVRSCVIERGSGCSILDEAAKRAVRNWTFRDGPGVLLLPIEFVLGRKL